MTTYIGIDPGQSGGIALLYKEHAEVYPMPETEADVRDLLRQFGNYSRGASDGTPLHALIESVHSMPKQGVASSFKFGKSYGLLRGLLIGLGIPFDEVSPQKWQKALGCLSHGDKNVTKAKAQQLYPGLKITHATADALLIARYAQLQGNGHENL